MLFRDRGKISSKQHLEDALKSEGSIYCEIDVIDDQGKLHDLEFETVTWASNENDLCYILSVVRDHKDKNALDRKLKEARSRADARLKPGA